MNSTISDVAKLAGVSSATVSRVINNPEIVSEKTKRIVYSAMEQLNYHPNALGRNLRQSRSGLIMVLVPRIDNPFYIKVIEGIQEVAQQKNYNVVLCQNYVDPAISSQYIQHLLQRTVDGLILLDNTIDNSLLGDIDYIKYPVVQCSQYAKNTPVPYVTVDDTKAMQMLVRYLLSTGRRRIALINGDKRFIYAKNRLAGYRQTLNEMGIAVDKELIKYVSSLDYQSAMIAATNLLDMKNPPDAIIGVSDVLALSAMKVAFKKGMKVPQDISIASFDNTNMTVLAEPSITSISQPRYNMGKEACNMLFERMDNPNAQVRQIHLQAELIIRDSTLL